MCEIKEFMRLYRSHVVILLEPKISGEMAHATCKKLDKRHWIRSKADVFSGGVWILWNEDEIKLKHARKLILYFEVESKDGACWELIALYASPRAHIRRYIWEQLDEISVKEPWVLIKDFNCVICIREAHGRGLQLLH